MFRPTDLTPAEFDRLVASSHRVQCRVDAWRGPDLLAQAVPVLDGGLTEKADQDIPEAVTLTVPARDDQGNTWAPLDPLDPLNSYGQRLRLVYGITRADGSTFDVPLGWFAIDEWDADDYTVEISALGLLDVVKRAELLAPTSPKTGATLGGEIVRLIDGMLPVEVDPALVDRAAPTTMAWDDQRLDAIQEIATAWPARLFVDTAGVVQVDPPIDPTAPADVVLVEGQAGTVVSKRRSGSRAGLFNVVVATGEDASADKAPVRAVGQDDDQASPTYVDGPFGSVVRKFSSPLLTTNGQAKKAADTLVAKSRRQAQTIPLTIVPDPRIGIDTRVDYQPARGPVVRCVVVESDLPLVADGGAQKITLGVL
jgi:hypothetical protein